MTIWFQRRDKDGVEAKYSVTVPLESVLVVLAVLGFLLFFASKLSVYKNGVFNSWGSKSMSTPFKLAYWIGCSAMMLGSVVILAAARSA